MTTQHAKSNAREGPQCAICAAPIADPEANDDDDLCVNCEMAEEDHNEWLRERE